jgi:hypothetical protein
MCAAGLDRPVTQRFRRKFPPQNQSPISLRSEQSIYIYNTRKNAAINS